MKIIKLFKSWRLFAGGGNEPRDFSLFSFFSHSHPFVMTSIISIGIRQAQQGI